MECEEDTRLEDEEEENTRPGLPKQKKKKLETIRWWGKYYCHIFRVKTKWLSPTEKVVLTCILDHLHLGEPESSAFASQVTLARETGLSRKTVNQTLKSLVKKRWLKKLDDLFHRAHKFIPDNAMNDTDQEWYNLQEQLRDRRIKGQTKPIVNYDAVVQEIMENDLGLKARRWKVPQKSRKKANHKSNGRLHSDDFCND
jgi:DNA-binding MarR family transcriptional regulator